MLRIAAVALATLFATQTVATGQNKLMSPDAIAAMAKVKIINQEITSNAFGPAVLVTVSNESNFSFRLLQLSCALMQGDKAVGVADPQIYGFLPGSTAVAEGNYEITETNKGADKLICRPAIAG